MSVISRRLPCFNTGFCLHHGFLSVSSSWVYVYVFITGLCLHHGYFFYYRFYFSSEVLFIFLHEFRFSVWVLYSIRLSCSRTTSRFNYWFHALLGVLSIRIPFFITSFKLYYGFLFHHDFHVLLRFFLHHGPTLVMSSIFHHEFYPASRVLSSYGLHLLSRTGLMLYYRFYSSASFIKGSSFIIFCHVFHIV